MDAGPVGARGVSSLGRSICEEVPSATAQHCTCLVCLHFSTPLSIDLKAQHFANTHYSNKAQLRELEHIRTNVLQSRKPLTLPNPPSFSSSGGFSSSKLKAFLIMARFIARTRIAARNWAGQEAVRQKLRTAIEEKRQIKRSKQLKVVAADVY